jgi:nucleoside-diphosphate-sugar epimerase
LKKDSTTRNLCIIGCGYIGSSVALRWSKKGAHVTATTRHTSRLDELAKVAQKSVIFKGTSEEDLLPLIAYNDLLLVTIAPDKADEYASAYLQNAQLIRHVALGMNQPRTLIYTSSTQVYGDHHGRFVDETSHLFGKSDQAKILIETESIYLSLIDLGWDVCVLRLGEIYGPGREISNRVKNLQSHPTPGSGDLYTNMIHRDDVVGAIEHVLRHDLDGVYNLADDDHPTRRELYDTVSREHRLPKVQWDPTLSGLRTDNKRVSNHKIKAAGYVFQHPHRLLD